MGKLIDAILNAKAEGEKLFQQEHNENLKALAEFERLRKEKVIERRQYIEANLPDAIREHFGKGKTPLEFVTMEVTDLDLHTWLEAAELIPEILFVDIYWYNVFGERTPFLRMRVAYYDATDS